jgi:hypothetical protein
VPSVSALRGRHWQRRGLKHVAGDGKPSRTVDRLRGMTGKENVSEVLALRIVRSAEPKRLRGSRPKRDGEQAREILTVTRRTWRLPRCTETPYSRLLVQSAERGKPDTLSASLRQTESPKRKCGEGRSGYRTREEAKAVL